MQERAGIGAFPRHDSLEDGNYSTGRDEQCGVDRRDVISALFAQTRIGRDGV
jgi:hypothetical protein